MNVVNALVNKNQITIQKKRLFFDLDTRVLGLPPVPDNWIPPERLQH